MTKQSSCAFRFCAACNAAHTAPPDDPPTNNPSSLVPSEIITQRDRIKAKLVRLKTIMTTNYNSLKNIIKNVFS